MTSWTHILLQTVVHGLNSRGIFCYVSVNLGYPALMTLSCTEAMWDSPDGSTHVAVLLTCYCWCKPYISCCCCFRFSHKQTKAFIVKQLKEMQWICHQAGGSLVKNLFIQIWAYSALFSQRIWSKYCKEVQAVPAETATVRWKAANIRLYRGCV